MLLWLIKLLGLDTNIEMHTTLFLLLELVWVIQGILWFYELKDIFAHLCGHWNFSRDCIEYVDPFECCGYFNNINFLQFINMNVFLFCAHLLFKVLN